LLADPTKAASEQAAARNELLPIDASLGQIWLARWETAVHFTRFTAPWPAIIRNSAIFTVEESAVIARRLYRYYRRTQAEATLKSETANKAAKDNAVFDLALYDEKPHGPTFLHETTDLLVRTGASVVVESLAAGLGTLILPGVGTLVLETIGSLICWI
jgi:hypothetical protein